MFITKADNKILNYINLNRQNDVHPLATKCFLQKTLTEQLTLDKKRYTFLLIYMIS